MMIDDGLYRWAQMAIVLGLPALLLIWGLAKRRIAMGLIVAVASLLGLTLAFSIFTVEETTTVFRVEPGVLITKSVLIGTTHFPFANGADAPIAAAGGHVTLVVNNTGQPMAVTPVTYSVGGFAPDSAKPDLVVPPFSAATSPNDIEYYGHDAHTPPHNLQANAPQTTRHWLTAAPP